MSIVVFAGPTLTHREVLEILPSALVRPPAAQGDVLVAAESGAQVIGIIDGVFERVPSVWHKEILWVMSRGVHVFGSASMGALRAAELDSFGMEGVGEIYEAFAAGVLDADDEVAVTHGPAESEYRAQSEALVNVRTTIMAAVADQVVSEELAATVIESAQGLFYPDRTYPRIFAEARKHGARPEAMQRLADFVSTGRIDQKRDDALAMLMLIRERSGGLEPKQVKYTFERTHFFEQLLQEVVDRSERSERSAMLLDEARLDPKLYAEAFALAFRISAARENAEQHGVRFDDERALTTATERYRRRRGLLRADELESHLGEQAFDERALWELVEDEARLEWHTERTRARVLENFETALRLLGKHRALRERLEQKQKALAKSGLDAPSLRDAGIGEQELFDWYFCERGGGQVPLDLDAVVGATLHVDRGRFRELVLREYLFDKRQGSKE